VQLCRGVVRLSYFMTPGIAPRGRPGAASRAGLLSAWFDTPGHPR
jgi:hypothetical protein